MSENQPVPESSTPKLIKWIALPILLALVAVGILAVLNLGKPKTYVGEAFGRKITQAEYDRVHKYNRLQSLVKYGKMFESVEPYLDLDTEAWNQLLILQEAKNRRIKIADQDVINKVAEYPYFFRDGKFDNILYRDILRNSLKAEPKEFEDSIRQSMLIDRLREDVTQSVTLSEESAKTEFHKRQDQVQYQYITVTSDTPAGDISVSEDEIQNHYNQHAADLEIGESLKIQYVWMPFPPDGGVQKQVETKFKGRAIIDQHTLKNIPLAEAAAKMKFELKENGFFTRDNPPADTGIDWSLETVKTVFTMKAGDISQPIEQKDGYAVIKVLEKRPSHIPTVEEVRDTIVARVREQKMREAAVQKADAVITNLKDLMAAGKDFKTAASELSLTVQDSKLSRRDNVLSDIGISGDDALNQLAAWTELNTIGPVAHTGQDAIILFLSQYRPVDEKTAAKSMESFKKRFIEDKKDKVFADFLRDLRRKASLKKY